MTKTNKNLLGWIIVIFVVSIVFIGAVFANEKKKSIEGVKTQKVQAETDIPTESKPTVKLTPKTEPEQNQEKNEISIANDNQPVIFEKSDNSEPVATNSETPTPEPSTTIPDEEGILLPPPPPTD